MVWLQVTEITTLADKGVSGQECELEVACSGRLICPAHNSEQHPQGPLQVADAIHVVVHHIASLAQEPSDLSADTNVHGRLTLNDCIVLFSTIQEIGLSNHLDPCVRLFWCCIFLWVFQD